MSRSRSRSRSKSADRSRRRRSPSPRRRRSPSPRRRSPSPKVRRRSRSRSRSASPSKFTKSAPILEAWTVVRRDPSNFDAWTRLITLAESSTELDLIKNIYDRFLDKYPFCYGYWQKYAEIYRRINEAVQAVQVYERGLNKIPLSIDLWSSFLTFMKGMAAVSAHTIETASSKIDSLYDKALGLVRYDYNSDRLWNEAIAWHESRGNWKKVCEIYDDLIKIPTAQFKSHFDRYMTIINLYEPDILLDDEEYENLLEKLKKRTGLTTEQLVTEETIVQEGLPATPGDEAKTTVITRKKHSPEALVFFRDEMKDKRIRWHEKTSSMIATRFPYEEQIKRPYFHVKELEISQLKNWREYLDFEILEGDEERINTLFNRCMIACALYDTMWLKYARWAGKRRGSSEQRSILEKGRIHCPKSINITIAHSALEESKGDYEEALAILSSFERRNPGYAAIAMRKIGVSRRKAAKEKNPDYGEVIQLWENLIHSPGTSRHLSSFYSIKLARFHLKCRNDRRLASKVLRTAIDRDRDNLQLHLQLIDLAYSEPIFCVKKVLEAFDDALTAKLEMADRLRLSQRKLDLLEDIGEDIDILQEHMESHQQLIKEAENPSIHTRKRRSEREDRRDRDRDRDRRRDDRRERDGRNDRDGYAGGGQTMGYFAPPPQTQGMYDYGTANYNYVPQPQFY